MVREKIDNRIRVLIENGVQTGHRSMVAIVGEKGKEQVRTTCTVKRIGPPGAEVVSATLAFT
jgi:hypothetical protein